MSKVSYDFIDVEVLEEVEGENPARSNIRFHVYEGEIATKRCAQFPCREEATSVVQIRSAFSRPDKIESYCYDHAAGVVFDNLRPVGL